VLKKLCIILSNTVAKRFSWMDQDATWYEGRPRSRPHCVRWGPSSLAKQKRGAQPPPHNFWPMSVGWMNQDATWYGGKLIGLGQIHIVLDGDPAPAHGEGHSRPHFSAHAYCGQTVAHLSHC